MNRDYLERGELRMEILGPGHGLARHGHARVAARGGQLHRDHREAAGAEGRPARRRSRTACGYIDARAAARARARRCANNGYGRYLLELAEREAAAMRVVETSAPRRAPDRDAHLPRRARPLPRELERSSATPRPASPGPFVQDNVSVSRRGVLRGLHFQDAPHAQGKLVSRARRRDLGRGGGPARAAREHFGRWVGRDALGRGRGRSSTSRPASPTASWSRRTRRWSPTSAPRTTTPRASARSSGTTPTWPSSGRSRIPCSRRRTGRDGRWIILNYEF